MTKDQIKAELRRSACEDKDPAFQTNVEARSFVRDMFGANSLMKMKYDDCRTLFLLTAEFMEFLFESEQQAQARIEPVATYRGFFDENSGQSVPAIEQHADIEYGAPLYTIDQLRNETQRNSFQNTFDSARLQDALDTIDAQRKLLEQARDALAEWDALIKHQYTGTREGMSDMAYAAQHGNKTLNAITEHLKAHL